MPTILSGAVLQSGSNESFLTLSGAQPALLNTPSTTTGYTMVVNPETVVQYSNILGNLTFDTGQIANYNSNENITILTPGGGTFQVYSNTFLNNDVRIVSSSSSYTSDTGSLIVDGGFGLAGAANIAGNVKITANTPTTDGTDGSLVVQGGVGFTGDLRVSGGNVYIAQTLAATSATITSTAASTSTTTGAAIVYGGLGVGGNINATRVFDSGSRVVSKITAGVGLGINGLGTGTVTGPFVVLTNTGVLSVTAGTGTYVSTSTGNIVVWVDVITGTNTLQYITSQGNSTTNPVYFNNTANATATNTGSVVVAGGVGVGQDLRVGGTIYANYLDVTNALDSTIRATNGVFQQVAVTGTNYNTTTYNANSLYIAGGVGMQNGFIAGGNSYIYGNLTVFGTSTIVNSVTADIGRKVVALSTAAGPSILAIDSGMTVGPIASPFVKFMFDGVGAWKSTGDLLPSATGVYNNGNSSFQWLNVYGTRLFATGGAQATNTATGALVVNGGAGITGNIYLQGQLKAVNTVASVSTITGAIVAAGGVGIGGAIFVAGTATIINGTQSINTQTGAMVIRGGLGVGGSIYAGKIFSNGVLVTGGGGSGGYGGTFGGTDTAISTSGNILSVWSTATLQSVSGRGNTTDQIIRITNTTLSTDPTIGALVVSGGVGIGGGLQVFGSTFFYDPVTFFGTITNVLTTNTVYSDNVIEIHAPSTGTSIVLNDGKDIGVKFTYYKNTVTNGTAFLGRAADTGFLEWYSTSTENINGTFTGSYGTFKTGNIVLDTDSTSTIAGKLSITNATNATSAVTGALTIQGGAGVVGDVWVGGQLHAGGQVFSNGSAVLTAASLSNYGVAIIHGGTGTTVSGDGTGDVTIWNSSDFQSVTDSGNSTTNAIIIVNSTTSVSSSTGALIVYGGAAIKDNLTVAKTLTADTVQAKTGNYLSLNTVLLNVVDKIVVESANPYPVEVFGNVDTVSSYYVGNANSGTGAFAAYTLQNNKDNYVEFAINSSNRSFDKYNTGSAYIYLTPDVPEFDIGNASPIKFYTRDITTGNDPILTLSTGNTITAVGSVLVKDNSFDANPFAAFTVQSNAVTGRSSFTLQNASLNGQSYTFEVGGNNRSSQNGAAINEGSLTIYDNIGDAYRLIVAKTTGNVLVGKNSDDNVNKLQVAGGIGTTSITVESTGTATVNGNTVLNGPVRVNSTATFSNTATFNTTVVIGSSALETSVTPINTTNQTQIDSFDATLYRSAKALVQVEEGNTFHLVEIVLLHDNLGQVYISQYGIISTGSPLGDFSADLVGGQVVLYFTGYDATAKTVNVVRTSISV